MTSIALHDLLSAEIEQAIRAADCGDFASDAVVNLQRRRWGRGGDEH
jgi:hypothetical protein